jgi:hypothetical protein
MQELSLEQIAEIKRLAERILCFWSDKQEIEDCAIKILKYTKEQPKPL